MFEKPGELLLYRPVEEGGLGLHHVKSKALAGLIVTFLQTAANPLFQQSLYHNLLYRRHCLDDATAPDLVPPPYYSRNFFGIIKEVIESTPLNPVHMTVKQWYRHLLERDVTMEVIDEEGRMKHRLSKLEERDPDNDWNRSFYLARLRGLSPAIKSFNFKLLQRILPCKERLNQLLPTSSSTCPLCKDQQPESLKHAFFQCQVNMEAGKYLLHLTGVYDHTVTEDKVFKFNISMDPLYELSAILVLYTGLELIWRRRQEKKSTSLYETRAELECLISTLRRSRIKALKEAGNMVENTLKNFPFH